MEEKATENNRFYSKLTKVFKSKKWFIVVFLLALSVRLLLLSINVYNASDFTSAIKGDDGYFELSRNLIEGRGFSFDINPPYTPNPLRPPLYPFFLAGSLLLSGSYLFTIIFQIFVASLIPILAMVIAKKYFDLGIFYIIVGILLALEPYSILMSVIFYTETLFTFFFLVFIYWLFLYTKKPSTRNLIWTAVFLGLAVLVKPTVQYLPLLFPFLLMWQRKKYITKNIVKKSLLFLFVFFAIISPWLIRNYIEFDKVSMSAQPGFNAFVYFAPSVRAIHNNTGFRTELDNFVLDKGIDPLLINQRNSHIYTREAFFEIIKYPFSIFKLSLISFITFFTHDGMLTVLNYAGIFPEFSLPAPVLNMVFSSPIILFDIALKTVTTPFVLIILVRIFWYLVSLLALFGLYGSLREKQFNLINTISLLLILYFAGTTMINGLGVNARFRIPVLLFIFSFAYIGAKYIIKKVIKENLR